MALSKINTNSIADDAVTTAKVNPAQTDITSLGTLTSATISGDLTVDSSTFKIDSSNNRLGVGTASPAFNTEISNSSTSTTLTELTDAQLVLVNTGTATANQFTKIGFRFNDGTYNGQAMIAGVRESATSRATALALYSAPSSDGDPDERVRINSSGNVGIGVSDPSHQLHIESSGSNSYATMKLEGQNRGGQIDMFQNTLITNQILGDQSGNLYFGSSGGFGQSAIDSQAYMSATNKAFGFRTSTFITTMADDAIKTIVTNGSGLIIVSSYTYGRVAIYKHDYIGGTTLITGDTLYYATTNTDGKYSVESGSNSFTAQLRNRFGGNADFKVMFIGTYQ